MAIAGLRNVPVLETSILRESQPSSSRRRGNPGRISTRASSILQMWRELEDECVVNRANERGRSRVQQESVDGLSDNFREEGEVRVGLDDTSGSENGSVINSESHVGPMTENDDRQSMTSEQSQDLGEVERERVRQIFREWMNCGATVQTPNGGHRNRSSRGQWLGETERERVRIVREWIQMTSQQREACVGNREEQVTAIGSQIEQVRDGQVLDRNEGQPENSRREIRRLCGRQALLDLLAKKEQERRLELQGLQATRPVSSFAHRNRIQSLARIRCFQIMRTAELRSPRSAAESELGLLRQRQTVSGLREGFLSRLDSNVQVQASEISSGPSENNNDGLRVDQAQATSAAVVIHCAGEKNDCNGEGDVGSSAVLNQSPGSTIQETNLQELVTRVEARQDDVVAHRGDSRQVAQVEASLDEIVANVRDSRQVAQVEASLDETVANVRDSRQETATTSQSNDPTDDGNPLLNFEEPSRTGSEESSILEGTHETLLQQFNTEREEINVHIQMDDVEGTASEDANVQESSIQIEDLQEQVVDYEEREWEGSVLSNQWRDDDLVVTDRQQWPGDDEESSHGGALENDAGEHNDTQEEYWQEHVSQETPRDWLGMPSVPGATLSGRADTYYFSDDDNVYNIELRELLNRRRVSSLLHSGFRESLDQLIQSYVERQTQAPDDWDLHEMSPPPFVVRDQEQLDTDHNESGTAEGSQRMPPTPPPVPQPHWGQVFHTNWSRREIRQLPGTEWETINDLRIDMARLQQRLNNMQRMLEACMDMQLELQRSVRQEVSAALNRSVNSSESLENILPKDSSKWDCVRKGICCICSDSTIDSLLYRCGHMCTCTKCANVLVQGNGKCPMCQAPVVEVIRSYFIQ